MKTQGIVKQKELFIKLLRDALCFSIIMHVFVAQFFFALNIIAAAHFHGITIVCVCTLHLVIVVVGCSKLLDFKTRNRINI